MVINSLKAVFFIAGGAVVAGGAAYVTGALDIFFPEEQTAVAALPTPQPAPSTPAVAPELTKPEIVAPKAEEPAASAAEEAKPHDAAPAVVIPSFDVVRVEPDGSLVIAGRAAPASNVEIVTGARTIGAGEANETGEFAIVLDEPLKPGDYTIVLRSTTRDAIVATSTETAIVAVPDNEHGQVLALVEQPGAPSRLITLPEAAAPKQGRPVAATQPPAVTGETAATEPAEPTGEMAAGPKVEEKPVEQAATGATGEPAQEEQKQAAAPAAEPQVQQQATQPAAEPQRQQQVASVAEPKAPEPAVAPAQKARIAVEAVEIEGRKIFVAGRAEAGSRVRVYANDILLGDSKTSDGGRFLVEAERDLPVGDYIVRADMLDANAQVLARAAVPFQREPGEAIAAVAPQEPAAAPRPAEPQPAPAAQAEAATPQAEPAKPIDTAAASGTPKPAESQPAPQVVAAEPKVEGEPGVQAAMEPPAGQGAAGEKIVQPAAPAGGEPEGVTAPKLQSVAGAVIIRRGDTLWRISKRVYGRGVRYTTLYLANQEQIEDPDRIWPGQVFAVPGKTESGENADMSAVADRIAPEQTETR